MTLATIDRERELATINHQPTFGEMTQMAEAVSKSGMFACKTKEQALTLLMLAQAEGLHPIQAVRIYHIIEGKPSMRADAMQARFQMKGGKIEWLIRTDDEAAATFSHPSCPKPVKIHWTIEQAAAAGLAGRATWQKYPRQMLSARVVSEGVRAVLPEVVCGLYTPEEVGDFVTAPPAADIITDAKVIDRIDTEPDLAMLDQFLLAWDKTVIARGFGVKTGRDLLAAGCRQLGDTLDDTDAEWRADKLGKLSRGDFDAILKKKQDAPAKDAAAPQPQTPPAPPTPPAPAEQPPAKQQEPAAEPQQEQGAADDADRIIVTAAHCEPFLKWKNHMLTAAADQGVSEGMATALVRRIAGVNGAAFPVAERMKWLQAALDGHVDWLAIKIEEPAGAGV